jgi:putative ABC transport system ATP-binding protein
MGPSGSGKTTLLSVLGCMLTPTQGTARVAASSTAGAARRPGRLRRDHIGFVFQSYHLFPDADAVDNVRLALDVRGARGRPAIAKAKEALLVTVGLSHKENAFPTRTQRRRAAARRDRARHRREMQSAILADEPTGALDSENGHAVMTILAQHRQGSVARRAGRHARSAHSCRSPIGSFTSKTAALLNA